MATKRKAAKTEAQPKPLSPEQTVRAVSRTCRGPLKSGYRERIDQALAKGDRAGASRIDAEGRPGCGQDVNDLIVKGGLDGKEHEAACPKCRVSLTWTAPHFNREG